MESVKKRHHEIRSGSMAVATGLSAFLAAGILMMIHVQLAIVPLAGFVLVCLAAPFFPCIGFYAPVVCRGAAGGSAVALTFDDGPDPLTTPPLLALLKDRRVTAAFFVTGENAAAHPGLIEDIVRQGHLVGNHSFGHSTRIFFKRVAAVVEDIEAAQEVLAGCGVRPQVYRPPVGIVSPRLAPALLKTGMTLVNFSCRPMDRGNRRLGGIAARVLKRVQEGDIVLLHDRKPPDPNRLPDWLKEIADIMDGIQARGMKVVPLSDLIGMPVMVRLDNRYNVADTESRER